MRSPESTRQLVDAIVTTDETTGQTSLNIPVPDKQTVANVLGALAAIFNR